MKARLGVAPKAKQGVSPMLVHLREASLGYVLNMGPKPIALLDFDPDLGQSLSDEVFVPARHALMTRTVERTRRQSVSASIPMLVRIQDRLVVLFMHLAERWGQVTRDGIVVHLPLTHELIARLSGARRPTVTTALSGLSARGLI